jgi:lysophospholipase L1-like esterase
LLFGSVFFSSAILSYPSPKSKTFMTLRTSSASSSWQSVLLSAVLSIACGILLAMAIMEGILRLVPGLLSVELQQVIQRDPDKLGIAHPYIGYLHKPNNTLIIAGRDFRAASHTDGYGFRNAWPWPEKAEIVAVGDSVTFGYGVEDDQAWPALVAKALPHNRLINLGLIGAGTQQYLRLYETFGTRLHPKVLLIGFLVRNDFWDANMFDRWLKSGAVGNYKVWRDFGRPNSTRLSLDQPIGNFLTSLLWRGHVLASKSHFYNLLMYVQRYLRGWGPSKPTIFRAPDGTQLQLDLGGFTDQTGIGRPGDRAFDLSVQALQRLDSIARANGTKILVILQPSTEEVYLPLMGQTNLDTDPGRPLRVKLGELGIPYLDLLPEFRNRAAKGEVLFFETDGHPNARGYALIAELVLAHLNNNAKTYNLNDLAQSSSS